MAGRIQIHILRRSTWMQRESSSNPPWGARTEVKSQLQQKALEAAEEPSALIIDEQCGILIVALTIGRIACRRAGRILKKLQKIFEQIAYVRAERGAIAAARARRG